MMRRSATWETMPRSIPRMLLLRRCAVLVPAAVLAACTASAPPTTPGVRIVSETDAVPPPPPPAAITEEARPAAAPLEAPAGAPAPGQEILEAVDEAPTTGEALANAIEWTAEGLRHFERGETARAHDSLTDARIILLEADLPEVMQERGLAAIQSVLPEDLRHHDPEAVLAELELALEAAGASESSERAYIEGEVRRILRRFGATAPDGGYLEVFVDQVSEYVRYYQGKHREFFERAFGRKHKYWPTIEATFEARGIPVELGYMALVESGFNPRAGSRAGALGLWQFIPSTGRRYQLRRLDDFYDVVKATEAASEYLLDLIGIFGSRSFLLAMAAYNTGESRIQRCLRDLDDPFGRRSFWEIRDCLARETREYVPRIMAAAVIGSDPRRFGFELATEDEMRERYDVVTIPSPTRLTTLAAQAGVNVADLRTANTDLASNATSTPVRNFPLYVPKGGGGALVASLKVTPRQSIPPPRPAAAAPTSSDPLTGSDGMSGTQFEYDVQAGDTLAGIAQGFGVTVANLREWNPFLSQRVLYKGDRLTIYPSSGSVERVVYRVRRGDTLSGIAGRHGVSWRDLAAWNRLRSPYRLQVGQELAVYPRGDAPRRIVYTVKKGNTLRSIADVFSVRYRDIMRWNHLTSSFLRVGQKLEIQPSGPVRVEEYRVRRGDTVAEIARRFGVAVRDVLTANGLGARTLIRPGQRLVVYVL